MKKQKIDKLIEYKKSEHGVNLEKYGLHLQKLVIKYRRFLREGTEMSGFSGVDVPDGGSPE